MHALQRKVIKNMGSILTSMGMVLVDMDTKIACGFFGADGALLLESTSLTAFDAVSVDVEATVGVVSSVWAFSPDVLLLVAGVLRFILALWAAA